MIASISQGGGGAPPFDPTDLLPVLTGVTSIVGGLFAYVILPVWVFYVLKDRVALTRSSTGASRPRGGSTCGRSCASSAACSASGYARS